MNVMTRIDFREIHSDKREIPEHGGAAGVRLRFDDSCGNGHNTFSITIHSEQGYGGCMHDEIKETWPEYAPLIKWHLVSTDGPLHYVANTLHFAEQGNLEAARRCAIWPDARLEELNDVDKLMARLPVLMASFEADMQGVFGDGC